MSDHVNRRILMVNGEPFTDATATGITLCNLFADQRAEDLAQVYTAGLPVRYDVCARSYKLSATNLFRTRKSITESHAVASSRESPKPQYFRDTVRRVVTPMLDALAYKIPSELVETLKGFDPAVVYTLGGSIRQLSLSRALATALHVPLAIHFMDDWPSTLYSHPWLFPLRLRVKILTKEVVGFASIRLVISPAMATEYHNRYGYRFEPFMNCVDRAKVHSPSTAIFENQSSVKLSYFGGLHLERWKVIRSLAEAIQAAKNSNFELKIYCRLGDRMKFDRHFKEFPFISFPDPLPPSEVVSAMASAGTLLHVESFSKAERKYTRFSISTKIPEYLAAGRPILAIGPKEIASIEYLQSAKAAIVATSADEKTLAQSLSDLSNPLTASEITQNAHRVVNANHIAEEQRHRFLQALLKQTLSA